MYRMTRYSSNTSNIFIGKNVSAIPIPDQFNVFAKQENGACNQLYMCRELYRMFILLQARPDINFVFLCVILSLVNCYIYNYYDVT